MIRILAVGKKTDRNLCDAVESYHKRLRAPYSIEWLTIPYSAKQGDQVRQDESERLLKHLHDDDKVILLDERGQQLTSPQFSKLLGDGVSVTLIIGGAYGVNGELRQRADIVLSLSKMVLPHQLVRLVLMEQIYRAQTIYYHHPYHHQ